MNSDTDDQKRKVVVPLELICDAIDMANDEWQQYLDIEEMEVVSLPEYPFGGEYDAEDQELADLIEEGWLTRFFRLPSRFDIDEYHIMEEFPREGRRIPWKVQSVEKAHSAGLRMAYTDWALKRTGMLLRMPCIVKLQ